MNLPNILTILRIIFTFLFIGLFCQYQMGWALIVFTLASFTDYFDGYLARKYDLVTPFGKIMDPIADKFLILSAFFIFMKFQLIAPWMFIAIFTREVIVTGLRLMAMRKGITLSAERAGKLKTVLQIGAVYLIMIFIIVIVEVDVNYITSQDYVSKLNLIINIVMCFVVIVTLWSGITFIWNNRKELFYVR